MRLHFRLATSLFVRTKERRVTARGYFAPGASITVPVFTLIPGNIIYIHIISEKFTVLIITTRLSIAMIFTVNRPSLTGTFRRCFAAGTPTSGAPLAGGSITSYRSGLSTARVTSLRGSRFGTCTFTLICNSTRTPSTPLTGRSIASARSFSRVVTAAFFGGRTGTLDYGRNSRCCRPRTSRSGIIICLG